MSTQIDSGKKITIGQMNKMKQAGEKIVMCTAYDYTSARLAAASYIDILLVGDSLGQVIMGLTSTVPVTLDAMIHHGKATRNGAGNAFIVIDMPFGSYHISVEDGVRNAVRVMKETECDAVKIEGLTEMVPMVDAMTKAGIPVVSHIGLTPQSITLLGGYKVQGKSLSEAEALINAAKELEKAGAIMIVLECIPAEVAKIISEQVSIPTIGIGSGVDCDGQVLVFHDLLGFNDFEPKFLKKFVNVGEVALKGLAAYAGEVRCKSYPDLEHSFFLNDKEKEELYSLYNK